MPISFKSLLVGISLAVFSLGMSASYKTAQSEPAEVEIGMFVASVFDLDFYNGTFSTIFWVWVIHDDPDYAPLESIEITNARSYHIAESYGREREDGKFYIAAKVDAVINQHWDISHFPFDDQQLDIVIESVGRDSSQLAFKVDPVNSVIGNEFALSGWKHMPLVSETMAFRYNSNFGEEGADQIAFPRVKFSIPLSRDNAKLFFEAYIGYLIAFLMCAAIWVTTPTRMSEYRIGLILAATFAVIGNKNVLESNYPSSPNFGLADQFEATTFMLIVCSLFLAVGCERLDRIGHSGMAETLNRVAFPIVLAAYLFAVVVFVSLALG